MLHIHIAPYYYNTFPIPKALPTSIEGCSNLFSWKSPPFPMGERLPLTVCVNKHCPVCWCSDSGLFLPSVSLCCLRNPTDRKIQLLKTPCTRHRKWTNPCDPDLEDSSLLASFYDARRSKEVKVKMIFRNYKPMRTRKGNWFLQRYAFWWMALYPCDSGVWGIRGHEVRTVTHWCFPSCKYLCKQSYHSSLSYCCMTISQIYFWVISIHICLCFLGFGWFFSKS